MAEFLDILTRLIQALKKAELKYVIVGGLAAIIRGRPRTTMDIDLIIEENLVKAKIFLNHLKKNNFDVMDDQILMELNEKTNATIFDKNSVIRLDLKIAYKKDEQEVLAQAQHIIFKGVELEIASIEQILYGKILYLGDISDVSRSDLLNFNDVLDFIAVFKRSSNIDIEWLKTKVTKMGLIETLDKILKLIKIYI